MNVTIICDVLGEPNNGTTIATLNLIHYLTDKGHRVKIVSADADTTGKENYYTVPALNLGPFNAALKRNGVRLAKSDKKNFDASDRGRGRRPYPISLFFGRRGRKVSQTHEQTRDGELPLPGGKRNFPYRNDERPLCQSPYL